MANTTSGLLDARCDSIPVLCISGQVAASAIGTDAFQECDAMGISRSVTKWNTQIRAAEDVADVVARAFDLTRQGRPRSAEHTSELQSLMRISYAVLCSKNKNQRKRE